MFERAYGVRPLPVIRFPRATTEGERRDRRMDANDRRRILLLVAFGMSSFIFLCRHAMAEEGCVSDKCHAQLLKGSTVHPVAESCEGCHQAVETPHPKKGSKTFKLTQDPPDL